MGIDRKTRERQFGLYAKVCVDMEMGATRLDEILVENRQPRSGEQFIFRQQIVYEEPPARCSIYRRYGHSAERCRQGQAQKEGFVRERECCKGGFSVYYGGRKGGCTWSVQCYHGFRFAESGSEPGRSTKDVVCIGARQAGQIVFSVEFESRRGRWCIGYKLKCR